MSDKPKTKLSSSSKDDYKAIMECEVAVICGRNNSGKSFLLKKIHNDLGNKTMYLGPSRYFNFNILPQLESTEAKESHYANLARRIEHAEINIDSAGINLQTSIVEMTNEKRAKLFSTVEDLLGSNMEIKPIDPKNDMSRKYISVDGYNLSYTSSGFRLITTLITGLLDDYYENVLIDEPELGISPELQGVLADYVFDPKLRQEKFSHLKKVIIATHSPTFINRVKVSSNFYVHKEEEEIVIKRLQLQQEINELQFFLLGNRFESLYLPTIIVLVEGKSDYKYLNTLLKKKYPSSNISILACNGDNRVKEYVNMIKEMLGGLNKSPYKNRIIAILDRVHQSGLKEKLIELGVEKENIVIWDENGIEYYYPKSILYKIFGEFEKIEIEGDNISANGISYKKNELAEKVIVEIDGREEFNSEFKSKLLDRMDELVF